MTVVCGSPQVLCLLTVKRWLTSCLPSPWAPLWPSTWRWWTCFPSATTTWARGETSSWGWPSAQGTGRWCLIGWWTRRWTASSSAAPSSTRAGRCWCFNGSCRSPSHRLSFFQAFSLILRPPDKVGYCLQLCFVFMWRLLSLWGRVVVGCWSMHRLNLVTVGHTLCSSEATRW